MVCCHGMARRECRPGVLECNTSGSRHRIDAGPTTFALPIPGSNQGNSLAGSSLVPGHQGAARVSPWCDAAVKSATVIPITTPRRPYEHDGGPHRRKCDVERREGRQVREQSGEEPPSR